MVSIIIPLIIYILFLFFIILLIKICLKIFSLVIKKPITILYYKINNISLSLIITITYIKLFIVVLYLLHIYNMPRNIDLKQYYSFMKEINPFVSMSFFVKINTYIVLLLIFLLIALLFILFHKTMYKEIYRIYIYYCYRKYLFTNKYTRKIFKILHSIGIYDPLQHYGILITFYLANRTHGINHEFYNLPWYHVRRVFVLFFCNKYYEKIRNMSPMLVLLYDCIFNDFVLMHVFYYLLFYIPFTIIHRVSSAIASSSPYLTQLAWEICYGKGKWLYAISTKYKPLFDNYLALELCMGYNFDINTELFLYDHTRFDLIDKKDLIYENPDGIQIKKVGDKFFEITENEEGDMILVEEWHLIIDKTSILLQS